MHWPIGERDERRAGWNGVCDWRHGGGWKRRKVHTTGRMGVGRGGDIKSRAFCRGTEKKTKQQHHRFPDAKRFKTCEARISLAHVQGEGQQGCKESPLDRVEQHVHAVGEAVDALFVSEQEAVRKRQDVGRYRRRQDPQLEIARVKQLQHGPCGTSREACDRSLAGRTNFRGSAQAAHGGRPSCCLALLCLSVVCVG